MVAWALRQVILWVVIGFVAYGVALKLLPQALSLAPAQQQAANAQTDAGAAIVNSQTFRADRTGHVVLDGDVNGSPVHFLVDTGATMVALTMNDATAAGFTRGDLVFDRRVNTANGVARVAPVTLRQLRIGQFSVYQVQAAVVENLSISLLGQSFLKRLSSYDMRDGVLTLSWE